MSARRQTKLPTNCRRLGSMEIEAAEAIANNHPSLGRSCNFPSKFFDLINYAEQKNQSHLISWTHDGTAFDIWDPHAFMIEIAAQFFPNQKSFRSLERQLSNWGFSRKPIEGSTYLNARQRRNLPTQIRISHPYFHRGEPGLLRSIQRVVGKQRRKVGVDDVQRNTEGGDGSAKLLRENHAARSSSRMSSAIPTTPQTQALWWTSISVSRSVHINTVDLESMADGFHSDIGDKNTAFQDYRSGMGHGERRLYH